MDRPRKLLQVSWEMPRGRQVHAPQQYCDPEDREEGVRIAERLTSVEQTSLEATSFVERLTRRGEELSTPIVYVRGPSLEDRFAELERRLQQLESTTRRTEGTGPAADEAVQPSALDWIADHSDELAAYVGQTIAVRSDDGVIAAAPDFATLREKLRLLGVQPGDDIVIHSVPAL